MFLWPVQSATSVHCMSCSLPHLYGLVLLMKVFRPLDVILVLLQQAELGPGRRLGPLLMCPPLDCIV